jgi:hypothetical protein
MISSEAEKVALDQINALTIATQPIVIKTIEYALDHDRTSAQTTLQNEAIPSPYLFDKWQDWAEAVVNAVNPRN